ncbi:DUF2570 domain-containing protein [Yersinia ruckeri]|uniref:DUF2570 domain-containing protein n=1 Tax=Yersinia ruckeri TaxID=29486 RepID=UPI001F4593C1|nr:DUF2570 domain-containing protein [Yersinia ruckeri]MCW6545396.1 DUF2570 domain-containing protein [Yersinia ruckeri]
MANWRPALLGLLLVLFLLLLLDRNSLSNQVEKRETALKEEQATNIVLGNIIDADQANEAANRAATARQLENERKLRNESDARLKRFQAAAAGDLCADSQLPDDVVSLLRE